MRPFKQTVGAFDINGMDFDAGDVFELTVTVPTMEAHPNGTMLTKGSITVSILDASKTFGIGERCLFRPFADGTITTPPQPNLLYTIKANEPTRYMCVSPVSDLTFVTYNFPITLVKGTLVVPLDVYTINGDARDAGTPYAVEDDSSVLTTTVGSKVGVFTHK